MRTGPLRYIAKAGDGSMRDALSLLDQCIAFYLGQELTYDKVLDTLGAVDTEIFSRLLRQILDKNITGAIQTVETLVIEGRELGQFVTDFTWYLRNLMLVQSSDDMEDVLDISSENLALLKEEASMVDADILMRYIRIFSELGGQIKYASQKRILIEIAIIKLCKPEMEKDYTSLWTASTAWRRNWKRRCDGGTGECQAGHRWKCAGGTGRLAAQGRTAQGHSGGCEAGADKLGRHLIAAYRRDKDVS